MYWGGRNPLPRPGASHMVPCPFWGTLLGLCPGSLLAMELRGTGSPFARAALAFELLRLEKCTPKLAIPKHSVEAAQDLGALNKTKMPFNDL